MKNKLIILFALLLSFFFSCAHKSGHKKMNEKETRISQRANKMQDKSANYSANERHAKVKMEHVNGVYYIPAIVNGLKLKFVFDTGASNICISSAEAIVMIRQGLITKDEIVGQRQMQDATGDVSTGMSIMLRTVDIGGIILEDVEALVVDNCQAPLLLGQSALSKFGKVSIDYKNGCIEFN